MGIQRRSRNDKILTREEKGIPQMIEKVGDRDSREGMVLVKLGFGFLEG